MDAETAHLLYGLGRAQTATLGRQGLAVASSNMRRAFEFYADTNDVERAISVAGHPIQELPGQQGGVELVARALQLVGSDSYEAGACGLDMSCSREWRKGIMKARLTPSTELWL